MLKMGRTEKGKKKEEEFHQTDLSSDITEEEILTRLPVKSLARFRCVNKNWYALLTRNPGFIQKHLTQSIQNNHENKNSLILQLGPQRDFYFLPHVNFDKLEKIEPPDLDKLSDLNISGSSNGLVCLSNSYSDFIFICLWNPATRQQIILPRCRMRRLQRRYLTTTIGFGFHPIINDYKVVILVNYEKIGVDGFGSTSYQAETKAEVYSLNTNSWKKLGICPYECHGYKSKAFLNGVVHWLESRTVPQFILSFDLADEVFRQILLPNNICREEKDKVYLKTFRGCLSLFVRKGYQELDVWVMKEYGVEESWEKLFSVNFGMAFRDPIEVLSNDDILFQIYPNRLVTYNLESRRLQNLGLLPEIQNLWFIDACPFVESLVPLIATNNQAKGRHAYGLRSQTKKRNVEERDEQHTNATITGSKESEEEDRSGRITIR